MLGLWDGEDGKNASLSNTRTAERRGKAPIPIISLKDEAFEIRLRNERGDWRV